MENPFRRRDVVSCRTPCGGRPITLGFFFQVGCFRKPCRPSLDLHVPPDALREQEQRCLAYRELTRSLEGKRVHLLGCLGQVDDELLVIDEPYLVVEGSDAQARISDLRVLASEVRRPAFARRGSSVAAGGVVRSSESCEYHYLTDVRYLAPCPPEYLELFRLYGGKPLRVRGVLSRIRPAGWVLRGGVGPDHRQLPELQVAVNGNGNGLHTKGTPHPAEAPVEAWGWLRPVWGDGSLRVVIEGEVRSLRPG